MSNEKKCSVKWEKSDRKKRVTINLEDKLEMVITEDEGSPESASVNCEHSIGESITIGQLTLGKELPADTVILPTRVRYAVTIGTDGDISGGEQDRMRSAVGR